MIKEFSSTVFNTNADAIVNTVNVMGVMGAGIALEFSLRYPDMYKEYKKKCKEKTMMIGKVDYFCRTGAPVIVNFPTKWHWRYPSKIEWIEAGLVNFCETYSEYGIKSVAFPKLGCSNGHLNWTEVYPIMKKYLDPLEITVWMCLDTDFNATGKEADMVNAYNESEIREVCDHLTIPLDVTNELEKNGKITRFWMLNEVPQMKIKYYKKLFDYFYEKKAEDANISQENVQLSMFE